MSLHKSLKSRNRLTRARSVLTRLERLLQLTDQGRWQEGQSVFGLPKVKTFRPKARKKVAKPKEDAETVGATAEETVGSEAEAKS